MIQGVVNDAYEAVVANSLQGPEGQAQDTEADQVLKSELRSP